MYVVYVNDLGNVGYFRQVPNTTIEDYTPNWPNPIIVDSLPNTDYADCFEIVNGEVILGERYITRKKEEYIQAIKDQVKEDKFKDITVDGYTFNVDLETISFFNTAKTPIDWVLANNETVTLSESDVSKIVDEISQRTTAIVREGRRKKDLILAMTTVQDLDNVDLTAL